MSTVCPFCQLPSERIARQNELAVWILDGYPISKGHSLIIPKRHVRSFFEVTEAERQDMLSLLDEARDWVRLEYACHDFNIGINDGPLAGQTVPHLHMHLIPRYSGDIKDPRGGVRWIIPDKADYWSEKK